MLISIGSYAKHSFPVGRRCAWQHVDNVTPAGAGCGAIDGRKVEDHRDTAKCFDTNPCEVVGHDDRELQMLILRDP